jgi:hypothetical protein
MVKKNSKPGIDAELRASRNPEIQCLHRESASVMHKKFLLPFPGDDSLEKSADGKLHISNGN